MFYNKEFKILINEIRNKKASDLDWNIILKEADEADPLWFEKYKELDLLYGNKLDKIMISKLFKLGF